ncbi:putative carboxylesterase [Aspergillus mulundensis]|uniref:Carboxylic ester hydrolase n=1 Tax=Aspergillus mulundensis TaxID=1810919 RepID=A0A3D8R4F6_9EURO|nr:Carboxylic ester hydrolase [Aspergillus mulundensis]RDW68943.1 Carboxylic ester hydrolase [Aspergillus mulundensis]
MRLRLSSFMLAAVSFIQAGFAAEDPIVDLGYAAYQGYHDATFGLNVWKGIRYASAPVGNLRWQSPQPVRVQGSIDRVIPAVDQPPLCPQSGAAGTPTSYGFNSGPGDEDCLFLNVYAVPGASGLPVLVWIHGGGYALFGATYDPSAMMNANNNRFITVEIQYRLSAFGFLSSEDVKSHGQLNAGLLDQRFALEWVQKHISKFGGDPGRVTVGGESAGAGSVMLQALAYGGREDHLFQNIIAASPYSAPIYKYNDPEPTDHYDHFLELAGCGQGSARRRRHKTTFNCLLNAPTEALQNASGEVSASGNVFGSFAFLPVIDGELLTTRPSQQLLHGHVMVNNNANDGVPLSEPTIANRTSFNAHISRTFPNFTVRDIAALNRVYQTSDTSPANTASRFDTIGDAGPTALNQSEMATGLQQTAFNVFAESTFDCPAQWLAEAYSRGNRKAWKYQYSATPAYHGADLSAYFSADSPSPEFNHAFQKIWGSFIINSTPVIPGLDATANMSNASAPVDCHGNLSWPSFSVEEPWQMDLNTTGGTLSLHVETDHLKYYLREGPGIVNVFRLVDAYDWEGRRGYRCEWWRGISGRVPL